MIRLDQAGKSREDRQFCLRMHLYAKQYQCDALMVWIPSPGQGWRDFDVLSAFLSASAVSWLQKALIWLEPTFEVARANMKEGVTLFCLCMHVLWL